MNCYSKEFVQRELEFEVTEGLVTGVGYKVRGEESLVAFYPYPLDHLETIEDALDGLELRIWRSINNSIVKKTKKDFKILRKLL